MEKSDVVKILNCYVMYNGHKYKAIRYEAWKDNRGKLHHSLCLLDQNSNSTVTAPIERIDLIETV